MASLARFFALFSLYRNIFGKFPTPGKEGCRYHSLGKKKVKSITVVIHEEMYIKKEMPF